MTTESAPAFVERKARILGFGAYPGRDWSITAEQWREANAGLASVPVNFHPETLGHTGEAYRKESRNVLEGKLGEAVGFSDDGSAGWCEMKLHPLLEEVRVEHGLRPSVLIHPVTRKLLGIDLVKNPHYKGAIVMADGEGDEGILIFADEEPIPFDDPDEPDHHGQQMHELASHHHKGLCSADPADALDSRGRPPHPYVRMLHDYTVAELGAHCPGMDGQHERVAMSDDEIEVIGDDEAETPREKAMRTRMEAMERDLIHGKAVAFADEVTRGDNPRALPKERPHIIRLYEAAARDDARNGDVIAFADEAGQDAQGSRVDALKAAIAARPRVTVKDRDTIALSELDTEPAPKADADAEAARERRRQQNQEWKAQQGASVG